MTRIMTGVRWTWALVFVAAALPGCETRPLSCGEYPAAGGPAVIRTRDQQVCETVRMRVIQHLAALPDLDLQKAEQLYQRVLSWRRFHTLEDLYAGAEKDGGPELAAALRRGVESVRAESAMPLTAECERKLEECLTAGAVKGAELAMGQRSFLVQGRTPRTDAVPAGARRGSINVEDLAD